MVIAMLTPPAVLGWLGAGKRQKMAKKTRYYIKHRFYNKAHENL